MKASIYFSVFLGFISLAVTPTAHAFGSKKHELPELKTVEHVDLNRYIGTWYDIAHYPQSFQKGCTGTTANYSLRDDGDIDVLNRCFIDSLDGEMDEAHGKAWVTDTDSNAKLKVRFFWPFSGNYWIIDLGSEYEYAVVGDPTREYLWILSRTPHLDTTVYDGIIQRLVAQGYDPARLEITLQK